MNIGYQETRETSAKETSAIGDFGRELHLFQRSHLNWKSRDACSIPGSSTSHCLLALVSSPVYCWSYLRLFLVLNVYDSQTQEWVSISQILSTPLFPKRLCCNAEQDYPGAEVSAKGGHSVSLWDMHDPCIVRMSRIWPEENKLQKLRRKLKSSSHLRSWDPQLFLPLQWIKE